MADRLYDIEAIKNRSRGAHVCMLGNGPSATHADFSEYGEHCRCGAPVHLVWVCNGGWLLHPYADLCWAMDDVRGPAHRNAQRATFDEMDAQVRSAPLPIITSCAYEDYPGLVEYPWREVMEHYAGMFIQGEPYFSETLNYAIAWASMVGVARMDFHGCDYIDVRPDERAAAEFWCGVAAGRGMRIDRSPFSHFLRVQEIDGQNRHVPGLYGVLPRNLPIDYEIKPNGQVRLQLDD